MVADSGFRRNLNQKFYLSFSFKSSEFYPKIVRNVIIQNKCRMKKNFEGGLCRFKNYIQLIPMIPRDRTINLFNYFSSSSYLYKCKWIVIPSMTLHGQIQL